MAGSTACGLLPCYTRVLLGSCDGLPAEKEGSLRTLLGGRAWQVPREGDGCGLAQRRWGLLPHPSASHLLPESMDPSTRPSPCHLIPCLQRLSLGPTHSPGMLPHPLSWRHSIGAPNIALSLTSAGLPGLPLLHQSPHSSALAPLPVDVLTGSSPPPQPASRPPSGWLISRVNVARLRGPEVWSNTSPGVSVKGFCRCH